MTRISENEFNALKEAALAILDERRREHVSKARRGKVHAVYINLTPGNENAPTPELIVETTLKDSNVAESIFHSREAARFTSAISALQETTYEKSN